MTTTPHAGPMDLPVMPSHDEWEEGALMAVSVFVALHDQPGMAADVVNELGLYGANCAYLDDYEKENLKKVNKELKLRLKPQFKGLWKKPQHNA